MLGKQVRNEVEQMFADSKNISDQIFTYQKIEGLPEPVQRYFKFVLRNGQHYISYVRLRHAGTFKKSENQNGMAISGEQYFTTQEPAFVWYAKAWPIPIVWIAARDTYSQGKGNMLIKLLSTFTVGDVRGREVNQSSLVRYLAETVWFPTALLPNKYLRWEQQDSNSARAVLTHKDITVTAIFHVNEKGEVTRVDAERYKDTAVREKWSAYARGYEEVDGLRVPMDVEAAWHLKTGEFSYARFRLTQIEFNNPSIY